MKFFRSPILFLYNIYAIIIFLALMFLILPFVLLSILFGRVKGGNIIYRLCTFWADVWFFFIGIWTKRIYEYSPLANDASIYVCNHISYFDSPLIVKVMRQPVRPLGKSEMGKIPIFGIIYKMVVVTVDRSSSVNRAQSIRTLKAFLRKHISIWVFPEGTFNMEHDPLKFFYDGAFRIALETQAPIAPVLFLDTYKRMNYSKTFSLTPGICRVVYLPPVQIKPNHTVESLKQDVYKIMEEKLCAYKAAWIKK